jgi:hypothetical protein
MRDTEYTHNVHILGSSGIDVPKISRPSSCHFLLSGAVYFGLPLVERNIPLDLIHALQRSGIVPRCIFHFGFVGCDGVCSHTYQHILTSAPLLINALLTPASDSRNSPRRENM